jgi:voltage-gated potassium channel
VPLKELPGVLTLVAKQHRMERSMPPDRLGRRVNERIERKGLRPRYAAYVIVAVWGVGVVVFGVVERLVDPDTFDNVWISMWWALQTVTTVGYGDVVPGATAGKVIASFLMLGGLSLYAVITGVITSAFVSRAQADRAAAGNDPMMEKLDEIHQELEEIGTRQEPGSG